MPDPNWVRFDRNELAGSFGDVGTDLPLLLAMIPAAGLDAASVFVMFGAMQILTGLAYGLPMPVQPLKAMAVLVIMRKLDGGVLFGGGLAIGLVMLLLSVTGALERLARAVPRCVVRGIQLGLGLSLAWLALTKYVPSLGVPGYALAAVCFVLIAALLGNRSFPPAIPVVALGLAFALAGGAGPGWDGLALSASLPRFRLPGLSEIAAGFVLLALPQLPLSLSNSVIATDQTLKDLFPERPVGLRKIGLTYAALNLINPFFGGVPVCHGCGGLAGHYAFGARTGGSVVIYGTTLLLLGLLLGPAAGLAVRAFPQPVLGVILLFEALTLMSFVRDVAADRGELALALLVGLMAAALPQGYVVGLVAGVALHRLLRRKSRRS